MRKGWFYIISAPLTRSLAWMSLMGLAVACSDSLPLSSSADVETSTVIPGTFGGSAGSILISVSAPNIVVAGSVINILITATTANGNPARLSTLNYDLAGGTSFGTFGSISSSGPGKYTLPYTGEKPGTPNSIKLVVNGTPASNSNTIAVIGGPPHSITILQGNLQNGLISTALPVTPQIQVKDVKGNGASNAAVNLQVTAGGGTVSGGQSTTTLTTDAEGKISIPWVMGPTLGTNTIVATVNASTITTTLNANAYDKPGSVSLAATNTSTAVNLTWTAATYTGGGTLSYNIQRSTSASGPFSTLSTVTSTTFNDTTAVPSTIYYYQVITNNTYTTSDPSNQVQGALLITNTFSLKTANASSYTLSNASAIDFTATSCELTSVGQSDANSTAFGLGTASGIVFGTLADGVQTGMKLGNAGGCDGSTTSCIAFNELNSTWTPQWANLVGYWKLNDAAGSTTVVDSSPVGTNTGTVSSTGVTLGTTGKLFGSAAFAGGKININTITSVPTDAMTISAWVKMNSTSGYSAVFVGTSFRFEIAGAGLNFMTTAGGGTTGNYISPGTWTHVAISRAAGGNPTTYYINGIGVATAPTGTLAAITGLTIGTNDRNALGGGDNLNGTADEVAIWKTALTAAEISTIYTTQSVNAGGIYTSRILDAFGSQSWTSLSWTSTLPFFKALPDYTSGAIQNETSTNYASLQGDTPAVGDDNLMTGIVGLWHLNETSGTSAIDSSGNNNTGTYTSGYTLGGKGEFNAAPVLNGSSGYVAIPTSTSLNSLGTAAGGGKFTLSAWVYLNAYGTSTYSGVLGTRNGSTGYSLVIAGSTFTGYTGKIFFLEGTAPMNSTGTLSLNTWYHIAAVGSGTSVKLYINGLLDSTGTSNWTSGNNLAVGSQTGTGAYFHNGLIDEVAIWKKALNATEVQQLYQRGASRLKFQVRSCASTDPTCAAAAWQGPDGSAGTYFSELNNMSVQAAVSSGTVKATGPSITLQTYGTPVPPNRYFQYRAILESDSATTTLMPELKSVTVGPTHYDSTSPTVVTKTSLNFNSFTTFTDDSASTCASPSSVSYNLSPDGTTWYYWNGTAWASGGSATNSNTASVLNTMTGGPPAVNPISQYSLGSPGAVYIKTYLKSDGTHQCSFTKFQTIGT